MVTAASAAPHDRTEQERRGVASVDVRIALFTVAGGALLVALERDGDRSRLPALPPTAGKPLDDVARQTLSGVADLERHYLEQLFTLSVPGTGHLAIIVSYLGLSAMASEPVGSARLTWQDAGNLDLLSEADAIVAEYALLRLRAKLGYTTIAFHLLPAVFTLTELQGVYEAVLGRELDKRNFRRRVTMSRILIETPEKRRDGSHRPAALYRFIAAHDPAVYLTPPWTQER